MMAAAQEGRGRIISMLLQHGADVNARDTGGYTALMFATEAVQFDIVQLLLENDADPDLRANDGWLCRFIQLDRCRGIRRQKWRDLSYIAKFNKLVANLDK